VPCKGQQVTVGRQRFSFVAVRQVLFADGPVWVSWCTNSLCGPLPADLGDVFEGKGYPYSTSATMFCNKPLRCNCGQQLLEAHQGGDQLLHLTQASASRTEGKAARLWLAALTAA